MPPLDILSAVITLFLILDPLGRIALTIAWALTGAILLSSTFFYRVLRGRGLMAIERLMGMVLVMVAVQMFMNGVKAFLAG